MSVDNDITRIRKLQTDGRLSPSKKLKIVERYSMYNSPGFDLGHNAKMSYNRRISYLETEITERRDELEGLHTSILDCKADNDKLEFSNCELEDEVTKLKQELQLSTENIKNLRELEEESMDSIKKVYELKKKEMQVQHDEKLMRMKESTSDEIKAAFETAKEKLTKENAQLNEEISELSGSIQMHTTEMNRKLIKLKEDHHKKRFELSSNMNDMLAELAHDSQLLEKEINNKKHEIALLKLLISGELLRKSIDLQSDLSSLKVKYADKNSELGGLTSKIASARHKIDQLQSNFVSKMESIQKYQTSTAGLVKAFPALELRRRDLHNTLQELKGNIRVFCRIRPPLASESNEISSQIETLVDDVLNENGKQDLAISKHSDSSQDMAGHYKSREDAHMFLFDKVFGQSIPNADVFPEISQLIQSSLDGYNVCVFAYGQTGSGKTFTMSHEGDGMIPLSMKKIFQEIKSLQAQGWEYRVTGEFIEIYNEQIVDLLKSGSSPQKHEIKHDEESGVTTVTNVTKVSIETEKDAIDVLHKATKNRNTASTMANERSSRSHSVFIINIDGKNAELGKIRKGTLNLIDLAGSERLNNSHAKGDRLKETQAINKSLSCLGDVIHSLSKQQSLGRVAHVPYRNSKLTYLLKNSLGGDSKTLMFVNISPLMKSFNESINSLRFATKVNNTKVG